MIATSNVGRACDWAQAWQGPRRSYDIPPRHRRRSRDGARYVADIVHRACGLRLMRALGADSPCYLAIAYADPPMPRDAAMRLFVALYPPMATAREMIASLAPLALPQHRATREDQVHLTLFFVGDTDRRQLDETIESVRRSAAGIGHVTLTPQRLVSLPESDPPRLVALQTDAPPNLIELQRRLVHRLSRRPRRGEDGFLPHITLCRYATAGGPAVSQPVSISAFTVESVALVESVLRPAGAEHRVLAEAPLG